MLRFFEALFVAVSGVAALVAVWQTRRGRAEERADAWRREREEQLDRRPARPGGNYVAS